ncbi:MULTISPECIES: phosphopentomutase [Sphingomonadales]|uniref:Phosphopentomutase n=1 Tax=Edaphosphingomonas haloaromaticamans TaxID=653954 RepID=A0A1S1H8W7_9SPHN|nr:phosphopentomutase [Sphingomonas haloaromaticamans]OHT18669.1 Phosphopentomutase [Sphingomonas haloaromaticamans]
MRAILCVLDSLGVGEAPDAASFGDTGANTFGHIVRACSSGQGDREGFREGPIMIPNLIELGLGLAAEAAGGPLPLQRPKKATGLFGFAAELSRGKDTPSGHWEMLGLPVEFDWGFFPKTVPAMPNDFTDALIMEADLPGILGNCHASGTEIVAELGETHVRSGCPIVYTSADSVVQIAAHEEHFGLERLYEVCGIARSIADRWNIGRVIARPFIGSSAQGFQRTINRRDLVTPPHGPTLLDMAQAAGHETISIGKVGDIFGHRGISTSLKAGRNASVLDVLMKEMQRAPDGALIIANFNDFDTLFGHRRDVPGYARALERFDQDLPTLLACMRDDDILILSADHGCDPTYPGSDHTREFVPIIATGPKIKPGDIGQRETFADIGQSLASHLGLSPLSVGVNFLPKGDHGEL